MGVLVYALESWVVAVLGLAWLSLRTINGLHSFMDEYILYSQAAVATLHIVVIGVHFHKQSAARAYMIFNVSQFLLLGFSITESMYAETNPFFRKTDFTNTSMKVYTNVSDPSAYICCPNKDISAWSKHFYFGGFAFFLVPAAVTLCFQTIQLIISAASLSTTQETLWPGAGLAYTTLAYASACITVKYLGFTNLPCPDGTISVFLEFITIKLWLLLALFTATFMGLAAAESILQGKLTKYMARIICLGVLGGYGYILWYNVSDTNVMTYAWLGYVALGSVMALYCVFFSSIETPENNATPVAPVAPSRSISNRPKNRTKFVVPIQTNNFLRDTRTLDMNDIRKTNNYKSD